MTEHQLDILQNKYIAYIMDLPLHLGQVQPRKSATGPNFIGSLM